MSCNNYEDAFLPVNPDCDNVVLNWPCGCQTIYVKGETLSSSCECTK